MRHLLKTCLVLAAAIFASTLSLAADNQLPPSNIPTPEARTVLKTISEAIDAKNFAGAETMAKGLIAKSAKGTADYAYATFLLASVYSAQNRFDEAIPNLESALACNMFEPADTERYTHALAQLYVQTKQIDKAIVFIRGYMVNHPNIPDDMRYMYAIILKESGNSAESYVQAEKLMRSSLKPPKEYYQLAASCAQDAGNFERACAYLERLLQMDPKSEVFWTQLVAMHYNAGEPLAAIVAIDRAQEAGLLLAPTNYELRIELYYSMERFREAAVEIEKDLKTGKIPNEQRFWEMLSSCYDNIGEQQKSLEVLKQAAATTKWSVMDVRLGEYYYRNSDYANAIINFQRAIDKGHNEKLGDIWILIASSALEIKKYDTAEVALEHAADYPDKEIQSKAAKLKKNLDELIKSEEEEKAAQQNEKTSKRATK